MSKDVVIVYAPVGGGHKAAALALAEAARRRGQTVEVMDLFDCAPSFVGATYQTAHLRGTTLTPDLYGMGYFAANRRDGALDPLRRRFDQLAFARLVDRVASLKPHTVVSTHHLPLVVLGRARRRGRLAAQLIGVVTDYTAHACWAEPGVDQFCVPCPVAARELEEHGVDSSVIEETGIPIGPGFTRLADVRPPAAHERLRVLVTSGSFGVGPIRAIVQSFAGVGDVELTVVCGKAAATAESAARAAEEAGVRARIVGFEADMAGRMASAHLVVGKAGGLTVTETMAAGRPMVLVGTVPGNELANERMVVSGGAGLVAPSPEETSASVREIRASGRLAEMGRRARSLVRANGADGVLDAAEQRRNDQGGFAA